MAKLFLFMVIVSGLSFGSLATAVSPDKATAQDDSSYNENQDFLASSVDGIMIPNDVLSDVQLKHQGFAVVHAEEIYRSGEKHYKLKVGKDLYDDKVSFYLIYTNDWKLVEKEEIKAPEPVYYQPEVELKEEIKEIEEEIKEEVEQIEREAREMAEEIKKPKKPESTDQEYTEPVPEPEPIEEDETAEEEEQGEIEETD